MALGGVARRAELARALGMHPKELGYRLEGLVGAGAVLSPGRGVYALPGVSRAATVAVTASGVLTCVSAAAAWQLPLLASPSSAHVAVPANASGSVAGRVPRGTVLHRDTGVEAGQRHDRPDPAMVLSHAVKCLKVGEAVAVLDAALRRGLVQRDQLAARRPRTGWLEHERAIRLTDPGSQSIAESIARVALVLAGLSVRTQVYLAGVGYVDMLVEECVVVEVDGYAYHSSRQEFREDRRRDREITLRHGLKRLRFAFEEAVYDTPQLVQSVRRAVDRPPTHP